MRFVYACQTDKGVVRPCNQDALIVKSVTGGGQTALLAAVCDGVGGLSHGEQTSRRTVELLDAWADYELLQIMEQEKMDEFLRYRFRQLILDINRDIFYENQRRGILSGTTLSAVLLWNYRFLIGHVGDSRIYAVDHQVHQLTADHSWVAQEIAAGRMTKEEARHHTRQNVILRCIGAEEEIRAQIREGEINGNTVFLLCTDGFWHRIEDGEWMVYFSPEQTDEEYRLRDSLSYMTEQVKKRGETDNITAIAIAVS